MAPGGELGHHGAHVGAEPRLRRGAGALVREAPLGQPDQRRDRGGAGLELVGVGVTQRTDPLGETVRGKEHLHRFGGGEALQRLRHAAGDRREELGMVAPAPHQRGLQPAAGRLEQLFLVGADGHGGVVRREHDSDGAPVAVGDDALHCAPDIRMPVPHSHVHGKALAELPLHGGGLRLGEPADRRAAADLGIARLQVGDELRRRGPAATHIEQVWLDFVQACRPPVGHQQHRDPLTHHAPTPPPLAPLPAASPAARRAPG